MFVTAQFGPQGIHFARALGLHAYSIIMIGASGLTSLQRTTIIYNPFAGGLKGRRFQRLEQAHRLLAAGYEVTLVPTTGPSTAGDIAQRSIQTGAELILAAGGDGTINEVIAGMVKSPVPLGILPGGTANVLANELGLGNNMQAAARRIAACVPRRIALGRLECGARSRHFLLMAGAGFDADTVHRVSDGFKARFGKLSYWVAGFAQIVNRLPEFDVAIDGRAHRCSFALTSRVRNYGGDFEIARRASLLDDRFEIVLFEGSHGFRYVKYLMGMTAGRLEGMTGVSFFHARRVVLSAITDAPVHLQTDGEYAGVLPATLEIVPDALTLLIPPDYRTRPSSGSV
jgi:YegS/Rv2252/BmrU family lipid kinase